MHVKAGYAYGQMQTATVETWQIFVNVCEERSTPPVYVTRPEMFRSGLETAKRRNVLKELHLRGVCLHDLMEICPLSVRALEYAIYGRSKRD